MRILRNALLVFAALLLAAPAQAEVKRLMLHCPERQALCPFYELVLTPPEKWVEDKEATQANRVQVMVPAGKQYGNADAVIYVKVSRREQDRELAEFVRVSQERWRASVRDTKIKQLPSIERANGKPAFLSYSYENPSRPQQRFEAVSFAHDSDAEGGEYVLMVVLTGMKKSAIDAAMKPYQAFLRAH